MIELWRHGSVIVKGKEIIGDIMIINGRIEKWLYKNNRSHHMILPEDIQPLLDAQPDIIFIGIGGEGMASLSKEAEEELRKSGIKFVCEKTPYTIELVNKGKGNFAALIHVTC